MLFRQLGAVRPRPHSVARAFPNRIAAAYVEKPDGDVLRTACRLLGWEPRWRLCLVLCRHVEFHLGPCSDRQGEAISWLIVATTPQLSGVKGHSQVVAERLFGLG